MAEWWWESRDKDHKLSNGFNLRKLISQTGFSSFQARWRTRGAPRWRAVWTTGRRRAEPPPRTSFTSSSASASASRHWRPFYISQLVRKSFFCLTPFLVPDLLLLRQRHYVNLNVPFVKTSFNNFHFKFLSSTGLFCHEPRRAHSEIFRLS